MRATLETLGAVALTLVMTGTALVAQIRYLPDAPGTWKPWAFRAYPDNRRQLAAQPLEVKALERQLLALNAILKSTAGFASPVGFSVETVGDMELLAVGGSVAPPAVLAKRPLPATLNFGAYGVYQTAAGVRGDTGETSQLLLFVNQLAVPLFQDAENAVPEFEHADADVVRLASPKPDLFGLPRYGDTLVLTKASAPIWAAVPLGEVLELAARGIQFRLIQSRDAAARIQARYDELKSPAARAKRIAEYKALAALSKDPGYLDKMMKVDATIEAGADALLTPLGDATKQATGIERELAAAKAASAALPAADRAAPACYASQDPVSLSRFKRAPASGCVALVRPNWALFNPALPRSAPQVLVIGHFASCVGDGPKPLHAGGCAANTRLLESLDRQALLAWLQ
ncbi:MAG: hypothetical protein ABIT71_27100 [Vicinamibacteraceae bacterium]